MKPHYATDWFNSSPPFKDEPPSGIEFSSRWTPQKGYEIHLINLDEQTYSEIYDYIRSILTSSN